MKLSRLFHILSVISGVIGVFAFLVAVLGRSEDLFGITKVDALLCVITLILIAIWSQVGAIHHFILEKKGG